MFDHLWRPALRKSLLYLLNWTEKKSISTAVKRGGKKKFWQTEIHLPNSLVASISLIVIFAVLVLEIGFSWPRIFGFGLMVFMSFVFLVLYLKNDQAELLEDNEAMMLLGLIFIIITVFIIMFKEVEWFQPMGTPIASATILIGILLSRRLALVSGAILCLILAGVNEFNLEYFFIHFFGSLTGVAGLTKVRNRSDLTQLGLKVALVNTIGIIAVWFFYKWPYPPIKIVGIDILWGIFSGFSSALIVLGTLPYLESFFYRTTNIKLLELADFNRPLLKRLMIEAPGTYHHSLVVASLAEQAAESIGANSLLARVGAYYHDIGKLSKPEYFIENQQTLGNPHDPLTPTMSSLIVISHVKEGVALAHSRNIDKIIIDCIEQHHGTSVIHYFYHRALEQKAEIKPENFRYPGPKPQNKETAILMLADAVEAASRALEDPSPSRLKDMVEKIINNKFTDGQFTDCPITLHDLGQIAESLVSTLNGIFHARIEYKESTEQKTEDKKQKPEDSRQKPENKN
ncbi:MAG: HDIG domain-containing protein [Endomicrobiales bacterium]|nr:HDIG domain-containing protein [Endomicrobiales bacterium]